jgi:hypothetical protein
MCGAPVVMNMMLHAAPAEKACLEQRDAAAPAVKMLTAGAPPPAAVIQGMEALGFDITHVYGLTEVYGPAVSCPWQSQWDGLSATEKARIKARRTLSAHSIRLRRLSSGPPRHSAPQPTACGTTLTSEGTREACLTDVPLGAAFCLTCACASVCGVWQRASSTRCLRSSRCRSSALWTRTCRGMARRWARSCSRVTS